MINTIKKFIEAFLILCFGYFTYTDQYNLATSVMLFVIYVKVDDLYKLWESES